MSKESDTLEVSKEKRKTGNSSLVKQKTMKKTPSQSSQSEATMIKNAETADKLESRGAVSRTMSNENRLSPRPDSIVKKNRSPNTQLGLHFDPDGTQKLDEQKLDDLKKLKKIKVFQRNQTVPAADAGE